MKAKIHKMSDYMKNNPKKILFVGITGVVVIVAVVLAFFLLKGKNQEEVLKDYLHDMGIEFYENLYYKQVGKTDEDRKEFLTKFTDIGIKINLDSLSRYNIESNQEKISAFKNPKTNEACNKDNSKVIIYPKEPYGQKDYRVEIQLDCGFESK